MGILDYPAPVDLTPYASDLSWSDRQLTFNLVDPDSRFHPDFGQHKNYLRDDSHYSPA